MTKQTAVEWLVKSLEHVGLDFPLGQHTDIIVQAKAMEREQIIDTVFEILYSEFEGQVAKKDLLYSAEQYYNETYGGDK
jgi:hypothetical protein